MTPGREALPANLLATVRYQRRRRRIAGATVLAGAAASSVAPLTVLRIRPVARPDHAPPQALSMVNVGEVPLNVKVQVVSHDGWDQVNLWFTDNSQTCTPGNYHAAAEDKTVRSGVVGTWPGLPGQTSTIRTPTTSYTRQITRVRIVDPAGRTVSSVAV